jgi:hypothetical protein
VLDPNPSAALNLARKVIRRRGPESLPTRAHQILSSEGFLVQGTDFYETVGPGFSGGYVSVQLLPGGPLVSDLAHANDSLSKVANCPGLGPHICLRHVIWPISTNPAIAPQTGSDAPSWAPPNARISASWSHGGVGRARRGSSARRSSSWSREAGRSQRRRGGLDLTESALRARVCQPCRCRAKEAWRTADGSSNQRLTICDGTQTPPGLAPSTSVPAPRR